MRDVLTYHEITVEDTGYLYSLTASGFDQHLSLLGSGQVPAPLITFDDGHQSHFELALPLLESRQAKAIFFVTAGWTGARRNYMGWNELKAVSNLGHEVHAHGWSHKMLTHCSSGELKEELVRPKRTLEDALGRPVDALSAPAGRWDRRVAAACAEAGYRRLYTSDPWLSPVDRYGLTLIGRHMVRRGFTAQQLGKLLSMSSSARRVASLRYSAKASIRRLLGDRIYQKLWDRLARQSASASP